MWDNVDGVGGDCIVLRFEKYEIWEIIFSNFGDPIY